MTEASGFYLLHRGWQDHPVFRAEAFSRRDAFVWMIEEAAFRPRRMAGPKGEITLLRGQFSHSLRFMARAWKWDEARVRRFITSLSNCEIIDAATDAGQTLITVCNYDKYQTLAKAPDAATDARPTQHRRGGDANENEGNTLMRERADALSAREPRKPASKATRLPADWTPKPLCLSTVAGQIADTRGADWMKRTRETFENHWRAKTGKDATKVDWQATWSNWIIEQDRRDGRGRIQQGGSKSGHGVTVDAAVAFINE